MSRLRVGLALLTTAAALTLGAAKPVAAGARPLPPLPPAKRADVSPDPVAHFCRGRTRLGCRGATNISSRWSVPALVVDTEPPPNETLGGALDAAYHAAPALEAQRYTLRASDEDYAQALSELRPVSQLVVTSNYTKTVPGRTTQASRIGAASPIVTANTLGAVLTVDQPLYTGGRASADRDSALAAIDAGREQLRGSEGDVLLQVITSYSDVRRDHEVLRLRHANLKQLAGTLDEVKARRDAGELTRTDIAQAETQLTLAQAQFNTADEQLEQDRAAFAVVVGHDPGALAPAPPLPQLPGSIEAAFDIADDANPDLGQALALERASRARIAAASAQGRPTLSLRGSAQLIGQAAPFRLANEDQVFDGQAVLTIPLTTGGRVRSLVRQANDRNAVDRVGIEAARRRMVQTIVDSWNAIATSQRNIAVTTSQVAAARVFDEGTFEEYRAGLRSTFDVLFAHATLRDAEIELVAARHDLYVAQAVLLRHIGRLEARALLIGSGLYDPSPSLEEARRQGSTPWDPLVRNLDRVNRTHSHQAGIAQPPLGANAPALVPATQQAVVPPARSSPAIPVSGTTGAPIPDRTLKEP